MTDRLEEELQFLKMGVGTVVWKISDGGEKRILLGKRNTNPVGKLALPGGTMDDEVSAPLMKDKDKNIKIAAAREIFEESGIKINSDDLKVISVDDTDIKNNRYLNFGCQIEVPWGTEVDLSKATHRDEMSEWKWFKIEDLKEEEIFAPCIPTLKSFTQGKIQAK